MKKTAVTSFVGILLIIFWIGLILGKRGGTSRILRVQVNTPRQWECIYDRKNNYATLVSPLAHPGLIRKSHRGMPTAPCDSLPEESRKVMGVIDPLLHLMHRYDDMMRRYVGRPEELPEGTPGHVHDFIKGCVWKRGVRPPVEQFRQFVELPDGATVGDHIAPPQSEPVEHLGVEAHPLQALFNEQIDEMVSLKAVDPPAALRDPAIREAGCKMVQGEYCKLKIAVPHHCRPHVSEC